MKLKQIVISFFKASEVSKMTFSTNIAIKETHLLINKTGGQDLEIESRYLSISKCIEDSG